MAARKTTSALFGRIRALISSPYRALYSLCMALGVCTLLLLAGVSIGVGAFLASLPDLKNQNFEAVKTLARKRVKTKLEDKNLPVRWTAIKDINRNYLYAIVMSEDSGFFEHQGIDMDALLDSLAENIKARSYEFGASTISQQVVKNLYLGGEKTLTRKLREMLITERLEAHFSKNEILELYLNIAEFGPDLFGVAAASRHYFGKEPSEINPAEGAFIALMLPSPRKYHFTVFQNRNLTAQHRRKIRRVLGDMLANDLISMKQYHQFANFDYSHRLKRSVAQQ